MIIHESRLIFVHIQKTGGNAVARAFGQPANLPEKHFTAGELRTLYGEDVWDRYFKFAFVRNPWDRLVSWWSMIDAVRPAFVAGRPLNRFQRYVLSNAATFSEFLRNCTEEIEDADGRKSILRNQVDFLSDESGRLLVDCIGRFENFQNDFDTVLKMAGIAPPELPHVNKSRHEHYRSYYGASDREYVREKFKEDIDRFSYRF